jgi:hypothetical protein
MKAIFFSILIFNTAFFLWEYRIGAPEIYLPQEESEILGANTQQIILLPEEISDLGIEIAEEEIEIVEQERLVIAENTQTDEADVLVDESATFETEQNVDEAENIRASSNSGNVLNELTNNKKEDVVVAEESLASIYGHKQGDKEELLNDAGNKVIDVKLEKELVIVDKQREPTETCFQMAEQDLEPIKKIMGAYLFNIIKQAEQTINYYFLLTERSSSLALMKANAELIKQKGLDVWQIEKGEFSQRISLGVFSNPNNVKNAKSAYMKKIGQRLEIIPQYKNKEKTYLTMRVAEDKLKEVMSALSEYQLKSKLCSDIK